MLVLGCHLCALRKEESPSAEPHEPIRRTGAIDPMVVSFIDPPNTQAVAHGGSSTWYEVTPPAVPAIAKIPVIAPAQFETADQENPVASASITDGPDLWVTSVASFKASVEAGWEPESHTGDYFGCSVRLVPRPGEANESYAIEIVWCSDRDPARRARLISAVQNAVLTQLPVAMTSTAGYRTRPILLSFERGNAESLSTATH